LIARKWSKEKGNCTRWSPDQNVFDIMQGDPQLFRKTGKKKPSELGKSYSM